MLLYDCVGYVAELLTENTSPPRLLFHIIFTIPIILIFLLLFQIAALFSFISFQFSAKNKTKTTHPHVIHACTHQKIKITQKKTTKRQIDRQTIFPTISRNGLYVWGKRFFFTRILRFLLAFWVCGFVESNELKFFQANTMFLNENMCNMNIGRGIRFERMCIL